MQWNFPRLVSDRRMKAGAVLATLFFSALAVALLSGSPGRMRVQAAASTDAYDRLPVRFVANRGQVSEQVRYMVKTADLTALFTTDGAVLGLNGATVGVHYAGANPDPVIEGLHQLPGRVNFLLGNNPHRWRSNIPTYAAIAYRDLYPGIDMFYGSSAQRLKSEFLIAPGADPSSIRIRFSGIAGVRVDEGGALVLTTESGELREDSPEIFQEIRGGRIRVEGGFRLSEDGEVGFAVGSYDSSRPLIIDPVLSYSTYLGGTGLDSAKAITVDGNGYAYVTGHTDSLDFPTKIPVQSKSGGGVDVFVAKLDVSGNQLIYCSYLGGGWDDRGFGIAVDGSGSAYVTGWTGSPNFPTTTGARQRVLAGGRDAFVAKLNASGSALAFSTLIGGNSHDSGNAIALDSAGYAYIAGDTYSTNFPVISSYQSANQGRQDAFVAKLKTDGSALVWSTYLGGYGDDYSSAIAVDAAGNAYVTGATDSTNFPTYSALRSSSGGGQDAFVTKLNADGRTLGYSTYLGGSGGTLGANEMGTGIGLDAAANTYVTGITSSVNFPVANAWQPVHGGGMIDAFITKLNPAGSSLVYSTYLGGFGVDYSNGIAVSPSGVVCVAGYTSSTNFPVVNAVQVASAGGYDAFVARLNTSGNALEAATYWGGSDSDAANAVFLDPAGNAWIAGQTLSTNFPTKNPVQPKNTGGLGAFVTKIGEIVPTAVFRAKNGNTMLTSYGSLALRNAGGTIVSDPGMSQNSAGDTYMVGRNEWNQVWMNIFQNDTQKWKGWVLAGNSLAGNPAVAALPNGRACLVARDASSKYWVNNYRPDSGFQGWISLGGPFASDPTAVWAASGSLYVLGRDSSGVVWSGRYLPESSFQGWISAGSATLSTGKPAAVMGSDGAAYVAMRGTNGGIWMARLQGDSWGPWYSGGGSLGKDPDLAAANGKIYAVIVNTGGVVYVQPFQQGSGNGWQGWFYDRGTLEKAAISAVRDRYFIVGKNPQKDLWWYQSGGVGWSYLGYTGTAASDPAAGPK